MPRILVAEDTADTREIFRWLLEQEGFQVELAEDGQAAWGLAQQNPPDLLLTDLMMPRKSGVELIKDFRTSKPPLSTVPIVAISAYGVGELRQAMAAGATAILRKPNDLDSVIDTVRNLLNRSRGRSSPQPKLDGNS